MARAIFIKPNGETKDISPENGKEFQLRELQGMIDGFIDIVRVGRDKLMVVDDEGYFKQLPINTMATVLLNAAGNNSIIVGNVLVCDADMIK